MTANRRIALLALFQVLVIGVMLGPPKFTNSVTVPRNLGSPVLALEVARNVEEVDMILGPMPSADRLTMRLKTIQDFAFLTGYGLTFVLLALMLRKLEPLWGNAALAVAIAAPLLDIIENAFILKICETPLDLTTQSTIDAMRYASYAKWACAFLAIGILTRVYFAGRGKLAKVLAWIHLAIAIVGIAGLVIHPVLFNYAMAPLPISLPLTAWYFWWKRDVPISVTRAEA